MKVLSTSTDPQTINQDANEYYSVNKDEYESEAGNNDYIVL